MVDRKSKCTLLTYIAKSILLSLSTYTTFEFFQVLGRIGIEEVKLDANEKIKMWNCVDVQSLVMNGRLPSDVLSSTLETRQKIELYLFEVDPQVGVKDMCILIRLVFLPVKYEKKKTWLSLF